MEWIGELERIVASSLYPLRVPIAIGLVVGVVALVIVARRRGWFAAARRHRGRTAGLVAVLLVVGLPVGWYLGSPLIVRTSLAEPAPSSTATAPPSPTTSSAGATAAPSLSPKADPTVTPPTLHPERAGTFMGADDFHFGRGTARLLETAPGTWTVRFEDFSVRNGPDLYVYLSPDAAGWSKDAIELGTLKATDGAFNYPVPPGTDVESVRSVVVWCKQFAVQFAVAPLA